MDTSAASSLSSLAAVPASGRGYLDRALGTLAKLGLGAQLEKESAIMPLLKDVSVLNETDVLVIGRTLQHAEHFNQVVRDQVAEMRIASRYEQIAKAFDTIIEDSKVMVSQLDDGKISFSEKMRNITMKLTRGSVHARFMKIRATFEDVTKDAQSEIEREGVILSAYLDFRGALKEAEILAAKLSKLQAGNLEAAQTELGAKTAAVLTSLDDEAKSRAQLARDEALRLFKDEERRFDRLKKIADNLQVSYNVGETVMARLSQTHEAKQTVYDQSVIFFTTNDSAFTSIDAALTSVAGLHEKTQALNAMKDGANRSLEALAEIGTKVQEDALKAGHGATISAESVKKLIDSVVDFQTRSITIIAQARKEATENAQLMSKYVDEGKARYELLLTQSGAK